MLYRLSYARTRLLYHTPPPAASAGSLRPGLRRGRLPQAPIPAGRGAA